MPSILVLNGPNLNLLGLREPEIYGTERLSDIEQKMRDHLPDESWQLDFFQSNAEHELVGRIQETLGEKDSYIIINPAAFTHTSVAIRDALLAVKARFIEVHLSNVHGREEFRKKSWISDIAIGTVTGLGVQGYMMALDYFLNHK